VRSKPIITVILAALIGSMIGSTVTGIVTTAEAAGGDIPRGAVVAFSRTTCPNGWTAFTKANGRVIVGLRPGGTLGGVVGDRLNDLQRKKHNHAVNVPSTDTDPAGYHSHRALSFSNGVWKTGSGMTVVSWSDGMDGAGAGLYPLAATSKWENGAFNVNTSIADAHNHSVDPATFNSAKSWNGMPYVQLTYCMKN